MGSDPKEARARAEARFEKLQKAAAQAETVWAERAAQSRALDEKSARLKSLRLAKQASDQRATAEEKLVPKRPRASKKR